MPQPSRAAPRHRERLRAVVQVLAMALLLTAGQADAQWAGSIGVVSDYRHRGVSFSDRRPAVQGSASWDHPSGLFAGAQATTVRLGPAAIGTNAEFLYYGGFARDAGPFAWEAGMLRYDYSGPARVQGYGYTEAFVGASRGGVSARLFRSNRHYENESSSWYLQAMVAGALTDDIQYFVQACALRLAPAPGRSDAAIAQHADARVGLQALWRGFQIELALVGTDRSESACYGAGRRCGFGPVLSVNRPLP